MSAFGNPFTGSNTTLGNNGFEVSLNYITGIPDPNIISDPILKITFKSLLKKDATTKEKSLTEFINVLSTAIQLDDLTVISWVQLYPKLSIDNSRNVRLLSHQAQSKIVTKLGKKYAKYLKDTTPVWLTGLYDQDRIVVKSTQQTLLDSFTDESKIDKLWGLFEKQILKYCSQVISIESQSTLSDERFTSAEESESKYFRVVLSSVSLLTKLVSSPINEDLLGYEEIFNSDKLWDFLSCKDISIKKTCFNLIKLLISNTNFLKDEQILKKICKNLVSGLKFHKQSNNIIYSNIIITVLETLLSLNKFDNNVWQTSKKFKSRIIGLLEMGSCSSSPSYYDYLSILITCLNNSIFNYTSPDDFITISKVLMKNIESERTPQFKLKAWNCLLTQFEKFYGNLDDLTDLNETFSRFLFLQLNTRLDDKILDIISNSIMKINNNELINLLNGKFETSLVESDKTSFVNNWFTILLRLNNDHLATQVSTIFNSLQDSQIPSIQFQLINKVISNNLTEFSEQIDELIDELPSYVEKNFIDEPLNILKSYHDYKNFNRILFMESIDNITYKIMITDPTMVGKLIAKVSNLNVPIEEIPNLQKIFAEQSKNYNFENGDDLIFGVLSQGILVDLIGNAINTSNEDSFIDSILKYDNNDLIIKNIDNFEPIIQYCFNNLTVKSSSNVLNILESNFDNESVKEIYFKFFILVIENNIENVSIYINHASKLIKSDASISSYLIIDNESFTARINTIIGYQSNPALAIANTMGSNIFIVSQSPTQVPSFPFEESLKLISYSNFLLELIQSVELPSSEYVDLVINLGIVSEIINDHVFLNVDTDEHLIEIQSNLKKYAIDSVGTIDINGIIPYLNDDRFNSSTIQHQILSQLSSLSETSNFQFYKSRVFCHTLTALFEKISLPIFNELPINYTKLLKSPLEFACLIQTCSKFLCCPKFERVRNYIASEIIGTKISTITSTGLTNLTLLTDLLNIDEYDSSFVPLQQQRLVMVIKTLQDWLDSDISYDDEFVAVRCQLSNFVNLFISIGCDVPEKLYELGLGLVRDNLGLVLSNSSIELKYFTLKLFINLDKHKTDIEIWENEISGIYEEIIELLLNDESINNQPNILCQELLQRIITKIPINKLTNQFTDLFKLLDSRFVVLQRIGVTILGQIIADRQKDFVVEYQLQKTSIDDDGNETGIKAELPSVLISNISEDIEEYIEYEPDYKVFKYLWSWYLIMSYFQDVTYKIRLEYINQLKDQNLVIKLLDFIFHQIDITDSSFLKQLTLDSVNYELGDSYDSYTMEHKFLLVHLYYLSFNHFGSITQSWFLNIRDRQLKQNIEKFSIKYISPMIINDNLDKVQSMLSSKLTNDENLTIKINRVLHEVKSTYLIDEQTMEMVIKIPPSYPLANVTVEGPSRIGVKETQWKAWLLASTRVITLQSGTIMESIELFTKNVSLHFSGFEDCAICYSILHQDHSLPSKTCSTCSNKFHAACLYKWFKSSGSSTCPLCRSTFNFRK